MLRSVSTEFLFSYCGPFSEVTSLKKVGFVTQTCLFRVKQLNNCHSNKTLKSFGKSRLNVRVKDTF